MPFLLGLDNLGVPAETLSVIDKLFKLLMQLILLCQINVSNCDYCIAFVVL